MRLWREYREAFQDFARAVENIASLKAHTNPAQTSIEMALLELERAHVRYDNCRDTLAAALLSGSLNNSLARPAPALPQEPIERVREIAELLWELEDRREGRADEDWFRAEQIIRRAAAVESVPDDRLQGVPG